MTARFTEPDADPQWANPTSTTTRYTIIHENDEQADALSGYRGMYLTAEKAWSELETWDPEQRPQFRVVKIDADISEVEP